MSLKAKLPHRREGYNQKCKIFSYDGVKTLYIRTGEHPAGNLKELRVDIDKEGTLINGLLDCFCILLNIALQNEEGDTSKLISLIGKQFIFSNFAPNGIVQNHAFIKRCTSPLDLIFRDLLITYCDRDDLKHVTDEGVAK